MAFAFIPLQAATYATITPADTGRASAIYSTQRQVSTALGVAVLATVLTTQTQRLLAAVDPDNVVATDAARLTAYHYAFLVAGMIAFVGAGVALFIHDSDAAASMRPRVPREPVMAEAAAH